MPQNDEYYSEVGFDEEDIGTNQTDRYKGRKGVTDRIAFVFPTRIKRAKVHYKDKYILHKDGDPWDRLGIPEDRLGAVIVHYRTNNKGVLEKPFGYQLKHWVFSAKKYEDLRSLNAEWPLTEHDIKVTCIEEGYQQLKLIACKDAVWKKNEKVKAQIEAEAQKLLKSIYLGADMTAEELRDHLGMDSPGPSDGFDPSDDQDFDDMLDGMDLEE